ncbi:cytochrome c [Novosphingobium sp. FSY-8]|uniref:Cytochrome c n=1 Tax=Novosphingobium ovatum TaxID=1908523 RepID=A0ABW9XA72_9SPHN|nr:cytochrome c [Novosphingobium ovatum]NBC35421.1 cytochrome c [Novosphingobium ovatum]
MNRKGLAALGAIMLGVAGMGAAVAQSPAPSPTPAPAPTDGGTQIRNATGGAMQDRSSRSAPEALFVAKCGMCHRQMGMGTVILARRMAPAIAMLEARDDLTPDLIRAVARNGMGNMPRIPRGEVSDAQLATIAAYLSKGKK